MTWNNLLKMAHISCRVPICIPGLTKRFELLSVKKEMLLF